MGGHSLFFNMLKRLFNKILDILHIEHHPYGTLRIAEYADGTYSVEQWNYGYNVDDNIGWHTVYLEHEPGGRHWASQLTLDVAKDIKERLLEEEADEKLANTFVREII